MHIPCYQLGGFHIARTPILVVRTFDGQVGYGKRLTFARSPLHFLPTAEAACPGYTPRTAFDRAAALGLARNEALEYLLQIPTPPIRSLMSFPGVFLESDHREPTWEEWQRIRPVFSPGKQEKGDAYYAPIRAGMDPPRTGFYT